MRVESSFIVRLKNWFTIPDRLAFLGLLGLLFIFYPDLFLVKAAPLTGDHLEQHYPWAYLLAQSVKQFKLPFWTPLIHCGFPLVAESQVGAFYIPNLLMYFFLPFHVAYSYMNLVHWFIAGWGTYLYAKQMKLGAMPAFVAAIIFTFGAAYGGAYYNMTSLKTICWFPVVLYFFERYLEKRQWRFLIGMVLVIGQSIVAGYLQVAVLTWLVFGGYVIMRIFWFADERLSLMAKFRLLMIMAGVAAVSLALAFPQIYLTYQLAILSNRTGLQEGYAYIGSMSPLVLSTLFNPNLSLVFRGNNLYMGLFPVFFVFLAFTSSEVRRSLFFRIWAIMTVLVFFLALGQWSPIYVLIIKVLKFYSFRVPAKFIGFICFGLAILAAGGFKLIWEKRAVSGEGRRAFYVFGIALGVYAGFVTLAGLFLTVGKSTALKCGEYFVKTFIYAKPGHPHSLEHYLVTLKGYVDYLAKYFSWENPANIGAAMAILCCIIFIFLGLRGKSFSRSLLIAFVVLLCADLCAASFPDIRGDIAAYKNVLQRSPVLDLLRDEKLSGRLDRIYGLRAPVQSLPLVPSENMLWGMEDIGVYSPFVIKRYYETIGLFGNINDSNFAMDPSPDFVYGHLSLLNFLNVSHIISRRPLEHSALKPLFSDEAGKEFVYFNQAPHATAFFVAGLRVCEDWTEIEKIFMAEGFDPWQQMLIERSELAFCDGYDPAALGVGGEVPVNMVRENVSETSELWRVDVPRDGFFVISRMLCNGWTARVNGRITPLLRAYGMFQAVYLRAAGTYNIELNYEPFTKGRTL